VEEQLGGWGDSQVEEIQKFISKCDANEYRLFIMPPGFVGKPMANGWFADWNNNDLLDFSRDKWNTGIIDFMTKGNQVFGIATGAPEPRQCLFFNKKVLEDAGIDWNTIYDMQRDGTWTWDAFEKLCAQLTKDTDANGVNDIYGLTGNNNDLWMAAVFGNNGSFFDFLFLRADGTGDGGNCGRKAERTDYLHCFSFVLLVVVKCIRVFYSFAASASSGVARSILARVRRNISPETGTVRM
jgi:ABC-type glycerol-3-phosphate transport system substrate-binding protein